MPVDADSTPSQVPTQVPSQVQTARSQWSWVVAVALLLTALISLLLTAFAWPATRSSPHDVPIAVAGPADTADPIVAALEKRQPGAFKITRVADTAAAEAAIRNREVYGAIDVSNGWPQLIVASAASPAVAQALQALGQALAQPAGGNSNAIAVHDLAALHSHDPRGAGLALSAPLVLGLV
jgi:hypothetical protein